MIGVENNERKNEPLASEIYQDLKKELKWKNIIIMVLIALLALTGLYHDWKWSQYETVTLDSGEGGYANYVGGENAGGIFNGEGYSSEAQEGQGQG